MLQQRWTDSYGPDATGQYANRSYWLCTENWPNQNYPKDLAVYNKSGGFSNGYVPLFIIVGKDNKVFWDGNSSGWESALQQAINEMPSEGVFVNSPVPNKSIVFSEEKYFDVSLVFKNLNNDPVSVQFESISDPDLAEVSVAENIMTITANPSVYGTATIVLKGISGTYSATDEFVLTVFDPVNINIEDFETGDFSFLNWGFSGNQSWIIENSAPFEGGFSARSGSVTHGQRSEMLFTVEYPTNGRIIYNAKTSSEMNYDYLKFYIDGIEKKKLSGSTAWQEASVEVAEGIHTFKWSYIKDGSTTSGSDCAWIDRITIEGGRLTGIEQINVPEGLILHQNYPNPFNPSTKISFSMDYSSQVDLSIFNHKGELIRNLFGGKLDKGSHSYDFDASDLTSSVYFYRLKTETGSSMKKMILLK